MAEKDIVLKEKLEHSGVFNFEEYYSYAFQWFRDESYNVIEEKYNEKLTAGGKDILFEWKATKKLSEYFKIEIAIKVETIGLTEVEVEIEGKKKKSNKGRVITEIKGALIKDPESKWDSTVVYKFMRDIYNKYVIPARIDALEDKVQGDVIGFKEKLKAFLELSGKR